MTLCVSGPPPGELAPVSHLTGCGVASPQMWPHVTIKARVVLFKAVFRIPVMLLSRHVCESEKFSEVLKFFFSLITHYNVGNQ